MLCTLHTLVHVCVQDERQRIESLGGDVTDGVDGVMRVNCSVSVSRAIGTKILCHCVV